MQVAARLKNQKEPVTVNYNFGSNLEEMRKQFGDEVVFNKALDALVIDCQSNVRRIIKKGQEHKVDGKPQPKPISVIAKEAQDWATGWKPSATSHVRKTAAEKVGDLLGQMSAEQKAALLKQLTAK